LPFSPTRCTALLTESAFSTPTIVSRLLARHRVTRPLNQLTERERDVLTLMAEGHSNQGICRELHLSIGHIFRTLGLTERVTT
jgi:DNA-binding NarL/FixJ family response regulator